MTGIARTGRPRARKWYQSPRMRHKGLILLTFILPGAAYYVIFRYVPMWGMLIAFQDYNPFLGVLKSSWVGFKHFTTFFQSLYFNRLLVNTLLLSVYSILFGFPMPVLFALMLSEVRSPRFRSLMQSISYFPHFISTVIICGLLKVYLSPSSGFINTIIVALGGQAINFLQEPGWFRTVYVGSGIWQGVGWGSIIYYATLTSVDTSLYEAADIDGANRIQKIAYISIPALVPTMITLLLMNLGNVLNVGFEKVLLLYNSSTYSTSDILSTYVYRMGINSMQYSFASAVSLFNNVVGLVIIICFNAIARKISETSLW